VVARYVDKKAAFSGPQVRLLDATSEVDVAALDQELGLVRTGATSVMGELHRFEPALTKLANAWKATSASNARVSAYETGYFVAYNQGSQALVARTSAEGSEECASTPLASVGSINDVAPYAHGALVLSGTKAGEDAKLTAVGADCATLSPAINLNANSLVKGPVAIPAPSSTLLTWAESGEGGHALYYRILGKHLCD
jgi:hypothetical protein